MVVGTGDLSESALGWSTYNGDHMSMYAVNISVPKTLVKFVVGWVADHKAAGPLAVSYTHLDVYKRQSSGRIGRPQAMQ